MPLNDTQIRNAKPRATVYRLTDGAGLQLEVRPSGGKFWRFRYRIDGVENMFAAGEYVQPVNGEPAALTAARIAGGRMTLAEVRQKLTEWRALTKQGLHPVAVREGEATKRRAERANTFRAIAEEWIVENEKRWTPYYTSQIRNAFANHLYAPLGDRPIGEIEAKDITAALKSMQRLRRPAEGSEESTARDFKVLPLMIRQWTSAVFRHAVAEGLASGDPTYALRGRFKRGEVKNHTHLEPGQVADLLKRIKTYGGNQTTKLALQLLLHTFVRTVELRAAKWTEFDLDAASWTVPGERMKMGADHWVPLSKQVVALLRDLQALTGKHGFLFPNERDLKRPMSATTLNRCLERLGFNGPGTHDFSAHGFRTTASTMLNDTGRYRPDVIERQLAHAPKSVRGVYNKAEYESDRRQMMQDWSNMIGKFKANR